MYYIYILKSDFNNRYYIGCTQDLTSRFKKHNSGYVRSTKAYRPWTIVYHEQKSTLSQARKRETQIKSWKSRLSIEKLIGNGPIV